MRHLLVLSCTLSGLLAAAAPAHGQSDVYRCTDSGGHSTFTDDNGRRELQRNKAIQSCERVAGAIATIPAPRLPAAASRPAASAEARASAAMAASWARLRTLVRAGPVDSATYRSKPSLESALGDCDRGWRAGHDRNGDLPGLAFHRTLQSKQIRLQI